MGHKAKQLITFIKIKEISRIQIQTSRYIKQNSHSGQKRDHLTKYEWWEKKNTTSHETQYLQVEKEKINNIYM